MQGDLIEACPVLVFAEVPPIEEVTDAAALLKALQSSAGLQQVRTVVMSQACDLEQGHVRNVILCPVYHLEDYRRLWEDAQRRRAQNITNNNWNKHTKEIKDGKVWNLTMLSARDVPPSGGLSIPHQVVDFHEVFSLPVDFLATWVRGAQQRRLRLRPPYREHLSQSFARFFMRVGLPQDIEL